MGTIVQVPRCEWCQRSDVEVWKCRSCQRYSCDMCIKFIDSSDRCVHEDSTGKDKRGADWNDQSELDKFCEENLLDKWQGYN